MDKQTIIRLALEAGCLGPGPGGLEDNLWEPCGEENVTDLMFRFAELLLAEANARQSLERTK